MVIMASTPPPLPSDDEEFEDDEFGCFNSAPVLVSSTSNISQDISLPPSEDSSITDCVSSDVEHSDILETDRSESAHCDSNEINSVDTAFQTKEETVESTQVPDAIIENDNVSAVITKDSDSDAINNDDDNKVTDVTDRDTSTKDVHNSKMDCVGVSKSNDIESSTSLHDTQEHNEVDLVVNCEVEQDNNIDLDVAEKESCNSESGFKQDEDEFGDWGSIQPAFTEDNDNSEQRGDSDVSNGVCEELKDKVEETGKEVKENLEIELDDNVESQLGITSDIPAQETQVQEIVQSNNPLHSTTIGESSNDGSVPGVESDQIEDEDDDFGDFADFSSQQFVANETDKEETVAATKVTDSSGVGEGNDKIVEDEVKEDKIVEDEVKEDKIVEGEVKEDKIVEDEVKEDKIVEDEVKEDKMDEDEEKEDNDELSLQSNLDCVKESDNDEKNEDGEIGNSLTSEKVEENLVCDDKEDHFGNDGLNDDEDWGFKSADIVNDEATNDDFGDFGSAPGGVDEGDDWASFAEAAPVPDSVVTPTDNAKFDDDDFDDFSSSDVQTVQPPVNSSQGKEQDRSSKVEKVVSLCFPWGPLSAPSTIHKGSDVDSDDATATDQAEDVFEIDVLCSVVQIGLKITPKTKEETWTIVKEMRKKDPVVGTWGRLRDVNTSNALDYGWSSSHCCQEIFSTLNIDTKNVLFSQKKQSVPLYASGIGILEPTRGGNPNLTDKILTPSQSTPTLLETANAKPEESKKVMDIPPVDFDWGSSGLTNPLKVFKTDNFNTNLTSLEPFSEMINKSAQPVKEISEEAKTVLSKIPNLSFMRSKVLMFPIKD